MTSHMDDSGSSSSAGASRSQIISNHFVPDKIEDASNPYPCSLFLTPLPPLASQSTAKRSTNDYDNGTAAVDILAYGGDDGCIYLLDDSNEKKPRIVRKFDDEVKAIAVSPDGRRVAIGFDDGATKLYSYDDFVNNDNDDGNDNDARAHHPFIPPKALLANDDNDDDDGQGFLSQADDGLSQDDVANGVIEFEAPRMDASIRQLAFDPRASNKKPYYLAVVSESGNEPLVIVDAASEDTIETKYLADKSGDEHDAGGVRSVAYSMQDKNVLLATLGMDGKLVTWDVSSSDDPSLLWDVCHKDYAPSVPKNDAGYNADAGDRGCRVVWDTVCGSSESKAVLYLPGMTDVQYRTCPLSKSKGAEALTTQECKGHLKGPSKFIVDEDGNGHKDTIVAMAVPPASQNDKGENRIVTGGRDGKVILWTLDLEEGTGAAQEIALERGASAVGIPPVTGIVWRDELHVAFADGMVVEVPVPEVEAKKAKADEAMEEASVETDEVEDELATQPVEKEGENASGIENEKSGAKVSFKENVVQASPTKKDAPSKEKDASKFVDDEADDGDDGEIEYDDVIQASDKAVDAAPDKEPSNALPEQAKADDDDDDDVEFSNHNDPMDFHDIPASTKSYNLPPLQPAFAPSSTPLGESRRILCWNQVGVVTLRSDTADEDGADAAGSNLNLVDIAFHDTAGLVGGRRPVTFTDNMGFIVGTLGDEGAMFASDLAEDPEEEDDDLDLDDEADRLAGLAKKVMRRERRLRKKKHGGAKGSQVYFYRFETFGRTADKDWVVALPDGERAMGCATGAGWGAVITSRRFLRLFTISGIQGPVHWIPGEPVTVVGRDRFVAIFYHRSTSPMQDGTQLLGYSIMDGITGATVATGEVSALSPGSTLSWVGFTDKCALSVMDSDGMLSILARYSTTNSNAPPSNNGNWMPMLDTVGLRKNVKDSFWPVEVHGGKLVCVPLRGGKEHPDATRRPVTTTLNLRIPLATGLTVKSGPHEESSIRGIFALNQEKVLDDYLVSIGEANEDDVEEDYIRKCVLVDKATLKLFRNVIEAGKVERGFDLAQRLHSEKCYDLAIQMADRCGHRKLSDRIEEVKLQKFPPFEEEEETFSDAASYDSSMRSERSNSFDDREPIIATRQQRMEMSRDVSPEGAEGVYTPQQRRSRHDAEGPDGAYDSTDDESPPRESLKRKFEENNNATPAVSNKKRINPFAKKKMESPAKGIMKVAGSPTKLSLSRASTFSTKSRQKQRKGKQIV